MFLNDVMDDLGAALRTIEGLRVFDYMPTDAPVPAALVGWPTDVGYDGTFGNGMQKISLPIVIVVGAVDDRTTRDRLAVYADPWAETSVKQVLESAESSSWHHVLVPSVQFEPYKNGGVWMLAGIFTTTITGRGAV